MPLPCSGPLRRHHLDLNKKAKILQQSEFDACLLQVATEEGMSGGEHSLFPAVKKARQSMVIDHLVEEGAPIKVGP